MKKENILVVVLVVIALGAVVVFNSLKSPEPGVVPAREESGSASDSAASLDNGAGIDWKDYTPGMALAREKDKSIFLYFHAPWCTYCTKLKMTTFKDEEIMAYLKANFICVQVDTDQNKALATEWQVTGLPTLWFLDSAGKKIDRMPGYVTVAQLIQILKYIHTKSYETMEFNEFVKQN